MRRGVLKAFDPSTYLATVQIAGSLAVWLTGVPVSRSIPSTEMLAGRKCAVQFFDQGNPSDAVVVAVYT